MSELKKRLEALADQYAPAFAEKGLRLLFKNRYFEEMVSERISSSVFSSVDRVLDHREEKKKGYFYEKNKYRILILTVAPIEKGLVPSGECRDYAFLLRTVERAHVGLEPRKRVFDEERVLAKIEKRIQRILKAASRRSPKRVCKNTLWDAFRYVLSTRYDYKKTVLGKEYSFWQLLLPILLGVSLALLLVATAVVVNLL